MADAYDIVIVGGGTAGLVLAARLSEDPGVSVAVLEAGEDQQADPRFLTPSMWPLLGNGPADWGFRTIPQDTLDGKVLPLTQGRVLGGTSAINSFLFAPTSRVHLEAWGKLGNDGWDWPAFEAALSKVYTLQRPDGSVRGEGPLQLNIQEPADADWPKTWVDSFAGLGFQLGDVLSGEVCGPVVLPESVDSQKKQRSFSANTYLAQAKGRSNLTVLTGAAASKIVLDSSNPDKVVATAVQFTQGGETKTILARKEVIVSSGTFNSPRLLEQSGIGGRELLEGLGIAVAVDNPHVGENLQNHTLTGIAFQVDDDDHTLDPMLRKEPEALGAAMELYKTGKGGPFSSSNTVSSAHVSLPLDGDGGEKEELLKLLESRPKNSTATPEFAAAREAFVKSLITEPDQPTVTYIAGPAFAPFDAADPTYRPPGNWFSVVLLLAHPLSSGSVHITSASVENGGDASSSTGIAVDPRYLSHPLDAELLAHHLRHMEKMLSGASPLSNRLKQREPQFADLEAARTYIRRTAKGAHHYTGTCAMMPREMGGVVDGRLRVHGCANLRVCDASVMPIVSRTNTQATVYGVAEMAARIIKEDL